MTFPIESDIKAIVKTSRSLDRIYDLYNELQSLYSKFQHLENTIAVLEQELRKEVFKQAQAATEDRAKKELDGTIYIDGPKFYRLQVEKNPFSVQFVPATIIIRTKGESGVPPSLAILNDL